MQSVHGILCCSIKLVGVGKVTLVPQERLQERLRSDSVPGSDSGHSRESHSGFDTRFFDSGSD